MKDATSLCLPGSSTRFFLPIILKSLSLLAEVEQGFEKIMVRAIAGDRRE